MTNLEHRLRELADLESGAREVILPKQYLYQLLSEAAGIGRDSEQAACEMEVHRLYMASIATSRPSQVREALKSAVDLLHLRARPIWKRSDP